MIIRLMQLLVKASEDKIVSKHYDLYKEAEPWNERSPHLIFWAA